MQFNKALKAVQNNDIETLKKIIAKKDFDINAIEEETFIGQEGDIVKKSSRSSLLSIARFLNRENLADYLVEKGAKEKQLVRKNRGEKEKWVVPSNKKKKNEKKV